MERQLYCDPSECVHGECEECPIAQALEDEVEYAQCESCGAEIAADELIKTDCGHRVCGECLVEAPSGETACSMCLEEGWVVTTRYGFRRVTDEELYCPPPRSA